MTPKTFILLARRLAAGAIGLALAAMILAPSAAFASTAANTAITNIATVNFNDAGGVAQTAVTGTSTVTVTLVASAVTLTSPANQAIAQGTSATLTYTITSSANGPDTYNLSTVATPSANDSSVTPTLPASISLGGTTLAAAAAVGDSTITVPYDAVAGATVNGIGVGSVIVVGGNAYTVANSGIVKNAAANSVTIPLTAPISGVTVLAGNIVGERKTFSETVPSGTLTSGSSGTQTVSTTAASATLPAKTTTQTTPTVITVNRPTLTVAKLVSVDGGSTFGATGNAAPGTSLVYKVTATNTGVSDASAVTFADALPAYLTYVPGSAKYATAGATTYAAAAGLTEGAGGYSYTALTTTLNYNPGSPGVGTVPAAGVLVLFYRATIN